MSSTATPISIRSQSENQPIRYADLGPEHTAIRGELLQAIGQVLDSREFVLGKHVAEFEAAFAAYSGAAHGVAVNSGTSALHLALLTAGVGAGDEVITVSFTFIATLAAIRYCGAVPILIDIDRRSFTMDPSRIERAITQRTKAIIPVHLYGQSADMDPILEIARRHGLAVIEDAAQAHGAEYKGRRTGSLGGYGCFSFYPTKNLGACGEGGIVTVNDAVKAEHLRKLRNWGQSGKYQHVLQGFNYRMDGIQGAVLGVKLRHLDAWTEERRRLAALYDDLLSGANVQRPQSMPYARHVFHAYTIRSTQRDRLREFLCAQGIETAVHYAIPAHLQKAYSDLGYRRGDLSETEAAASEVLSLPIHAGINAAAVERVTGSLRSFG